MLQTKKDIVKGKNLYKREGGKNFYIRFMIRGKKIVRCTGKAEESLARDVAWEIYKAEAGFSNKKVSLLRQRSEPFINDVLKVYLDNITTFCPSCSRKTAAQNANSLVLILKKANNINTLDRIRLSDITDKTVHAWRKAEYAARGIGENLKTNYSLNSTLRQAKAVFSRQAINLYKKHKITIPECVQGFTGVPYLKQMKTTFVPISKEADDRIKSLAEKQIRIAGGENIPLTPDEQEKLPTTQDAVAVELARYCGLTASEIRAICWDWIEYPENKSEDPEIVVKYRPPQNGRPEFVSKWNSKYGRVPVARDRVERWRKALNPQSETQPIIPGSQSEKIISATPWLKQFFEDGEDRSKGLHELRKMAGSDIATNTGSLMRAARFIRDSYTTTERHYASFLQKTRAL